MRCRRTFFCKTSVPVPGCAGNGKRGFRLFSFPWFWFAAAAAILCANALPPSVQGDETANNTDVIRIEEDWYLQIGEPDPEKTAPQIFTVISPHADINNTYAVFELNHKTQPDYSAGGMQLQTWNGNSLLTYRDTPHTEKLSNQDEVIRFTVVMRIENGNLEFEIVNGSSNTWGKFGGQGYLRAVVATTLQNLNGYDSALSIKESKVGYAAHRVKKLSRSAVRLYSTTGLLSEDKTEQIVHQHTDNDN